MTHIIKKKNNTISECKPKQFVEFPEEITSAFIGDSGTPYNLTQQLSQSLP